MNSATAMGRAAAPETANRSCPPNVARMQSPFGLLEYLSPVLRYSRSPAYFDKPPVPVGSSQPQWLPKPSPRRTGKLKR